MSVSVGSWTSEVPWTRSKQGHARQPQDNKALTPVLLYSRLGAHVHGLLVAGHSSTLASAWRHTYYVVDTDVLWYADQGWVWDRPNAYRSEGSRKGDGVAGAAWRYCDMMLALPSLSLVARRGGVSPSVPLSCEPANLYYDGSLHDYRRANMVPLL